MLRTISWTRSSVLPLFIPRGRAVFNAVPKHLQCVNTVNIRSFSNDSFEEALKKVKKEREKAILEVTVKPLEVEGSSKKEDFSDSSKDDTASTPEKEARPINIAELRYRAFDMMRNAREIFEDNLKGAWSEMTGSNKESVLEKKFEQSQSFRRAKVSEDGEEEEEAPRTDGPTALVVVPAAKSYWEQMASRLDAPIIREILKGAKVYQKAAADTDIGKQASKASQNVRDKIEDAREFWETSQNPIIHTLSGVWENITGETEEGLTVAEIRKKDPAFVKENWTEEVKKTLAPLVIRAHLEGDSKTLKPWLTEGVYSRLAAEIRARKADGIVFDANILEIDENSVILKFLESGGPVILVVYMVQQINCIRNKKGEILEGAEGEIKAKFYALAFQQVYEEINGDENNAVLKWKVVDYQLAGEVPYY